MLKNLNLKEMNYKKFIADWAAVIATIVAIIYFSIAMPTQFLTSSNITTILRAIAVTTVLGMGLTLIFAIGGFDLSAGQMATMAGFLCMSMCIWFGVGTVGAIIYSIIGVMLITCISLFLIVKCKIPDLLATLAMTFFLEGLSLTYSGGGAISAGMPRPNGAASIGSVPSSLTTLGQSPTVIYIMLVSVILVHVFLNYTKHGRFIYSVGGNKTAARLSGIPYKKYRIATGMLAAMFIAIAGVLVCARNSSAQINGAVAYQMPALSAVFIGRSVAGQGKANAIGTFIGAILVGVLDNGLIMVGVPYYSLSAIKGVVLALALASAYFSAKEE